MNANFYIKCCLLKCCLIISILLFNSNFIEAQTEVLFLKERIKEPTLKHVWDITFTDFDADYYTDFIISEEDVNEDVNKFTFVKNFGNYNFAAVADFTLTDQNIVRKWFDYDLDGDLDLFYVYLSELYLLEQNCNFNFESRIKIAETDRIRNFEFIDLDNNKTLELIVDNFSRRDIEIYNLKNDKIYLDTPNYKIDYSNYSLFYLTHDVNNDKLIDIIIADEQSNEFKLKLILNSPNGFLSDTILDSFQIDFSSSIRMFFKSDLEKDTAMDFYVGMGGSKPMYKYNIGTNLITEKDSIFFEDVNLASSQPKIFDIDGNGFDDLVFPYYYFANINGNLSKIPSSLLAAQNLYFFHADANNKFELLSVQKVNQNSPFEIDLFKNYNGISFEDTIDAYPKNDFALEEIKSKDLNNDGSQDIYGLDPNLNALASLQNDGHGSFTPTHITTATKIESIVDFAAGNFSNNNQMDFICINAFEVASDSFLNNLYLYKNKDGINFEELLIESIPEGSYKEIKAADLDSDLDDDLIVLTAFNSYLIFTNDGLGNFSFSTKLENAFETIILEDIDADKDLDIFTNYRNSDLQYFILVNDGLGNFTPTFNFQDISSTTFTKLYDVNKDGLADVINYSNGVNYFKNIGNAQFSFETSFSGLETLQLSSFTSFGKDNFEIADLNMDGYLDIISYDFVVDLDLFNTIAVIYYGQENFNFIAKDGRPEFQNILLKDKFLFNDFDNDTDIDFIFPATSSPYYYQNTKVLKNTIFQNNTQEVVEQEPFQNCHSFQLEKEYDEIELKLINLNGQVIKTEKLNNVSRISYTFKVPQGIYILQALTNTGEQFSFKLRK